MVAWSASGAGGKDKYQALDAMTRGDLEAVEQSERLMAQFEVMNMPSKVWKTEDAVCGGVANVGAYLAGSPVCMRQRRRSEAVASPLSIVVDVSCSSGISADDMKKRGAAILALVRFLGVSRPVNVFIMISGTRSAGHDACFHIIKLESSPLDLARAAYALAHPSVYRTLGRPALTADTETGAEEGRWRWAYSEASIGTETFRKHARKILSRFTTEAEEAVLVPMAHLGDQAISNPAQWVKDMLAKYGGATVE